MSTQSILWSSRCCCRTVWMCLYKLLATIVWVVVRVEHLNLQNKKKENRITNRMQILTTKMDFDQDFLHHSFLPAGWQTSVPIILRRNKITTIIKTKLMLISRKHWSNLAEVLAWLCVGPKQGTAISIAEISQKVNKHWHDLHQFVSDFVVWFGDPECVWRQGVWADIYQGVGTICIIYVIGVTCSSGCGSGIRHVTHLFLVPRGSTATSASSSERWTTPTSTTTTNVRLRLHRASASILQRH